MSLKQNKAFKMKCPECGEVIFFYGITEREYIDLCYNDTKACNICEECGAILNPNY